MLLKIGLSTQNCLWCLTIIIVTNIFARLDDNLSLMATMHFLKTRKFCGHLQNVFDVYKIVTCTKRLQKPVCWLHWQLKKKMLLGFINAPSLKGKKMWLFNTKWILTHWLMPKLSLMFVKTGNVGSHGLVFQSKWIFGFYSPEGGTIPLPSKRTQRLNTGRLRGGGMGGSQSSRMV